jgi:hypothetical protein
MRPAAVVLTSLSLVLVACGPAAPTPPQLSATVFETRFDPPLGQLHLRVANESPDAVRVLSAELQTSAYPAADGFDRPQTVPSGAARDLPITLGTPDCADTDAALATATIRIYLESSDGSPQQLDLPLADAAVLAATIERDCRAAALASHVALAPPAELLWTPGAGTPAVLEFIATATSSAGSATIHSVGPTTLLGIVDAAGTRATPLAIELTIDARSATTTIPVRIVPARCDPHAIAEDKQGTLIPFDVDTSEGAGGQVRIAVSDEVRAQIYDFVTDFCAVTGG